MMKGGRQPLYQTLAEAGASGLFLYQDGRLQYANAAGETMTGYSREEILEADPWSLIHPDSREALRQRLAEWGKPRTESCRCEVRIAARGGEEKWLEVVATAVRYRSRPAVVITAFDITERKRLESQLRQAQKMEALGRLAGGVAHDFNNLLTVISGYGQMLLNRLDAASPLRADIEEILKSASRAAALTGQLLDFSRSRNPQPRVLDLNALVVNTLKMLRRVIGEDISLTTALQPGVGNIKAGPGQVEQILMNLAVNARDAMPSGGVLTIETSRQEVREAAPGATMGPGSYAVLSVSDTGRGMDAETLSHLFEPFFTTKAPGRGTGLGLSTVYGIVRQSGGDITVRSAPGKGTTFSVHFPRFEEAVEALPAGAAPGAPRSCGGETILVVEDDAVLRRLLRDVLKKENYQVLEAADGEAAIERARSAASPIDLLLTDVVLPGIGGAELAGRLAASRSELPVLYITGYAGRAQFSGDAALLRKPFTIAELTRKVREVLDQAPRTRQAGKAC
jgi:PAS domain S-box-containing protein